MTNKAYVNDANANMPDYFRSSINRAADKRASLVLMNKIHNGFSHVFFSGIGTFSLQMKDSNHPYQVTPRRIANALQESLKEELERLQKQQIIVPLGKDEASEWCKSFVLVPKVNGKVRLHLNQLGLTKH